MSNGWPIFACVVVITYYILGCCWGIFKCLLVLEEGAPPTRPTCGRRRVDHRQALPLASSSAPLTMEENGPAGYQHQLVRVCSRGGYCSGYTWSLIPVPQVPLPRRERFDQYVVVALQEPIVVPDRGAPAPGAAETQGPALPEPVPLPSPEPAVTPIPTPAPANVDDLAPPSYDPPPTYYESIFLQFIQRTA